jgi:hypothetical protein
MARGPERSLGRHCDDIVRLIDDVLGDRPDPANQPEQKVVTRACRS